MNFNKDLVKVQLPTGLIKIISIYCLVTLGRASNYNNKKEFLTKAGFNRNLGFRPIVRGVAMNPVDHPHGGRTKTNSPELTP
jgi:large subunit ribosomal protein L2